jgi:hypothetical protein
MQLGQHSDVIQVALADPGPQRRLTVAFRAILLIPHLVVLFVLGIAAYALEIIGWFAALILGRLPKGLADFIAGTLRYYVRVLAYFYLLTDRYPPFALSPAPGYPVDVYANPGRLNRLAVLFRIILYIPAYVVIGLLGSGASIVLFFDWVITLVAGRTPDSLHQALSAALRYQTRAFAYIGLLTGTYPGGLFGDPAWADAPPAPYPPQAEYVPPSAAPYPVQAEYPAQAEYPPAGQGYPPAGQEYPPPPGQYPPPPEFPSVSQYPPQYPPPGQYAAPPYPGAAQPPSTRLVLTTAAKRLVVVMLVIGLLSDIGYTVAAVARGASTSGSSDTSATLSSDYSALSQDGTSFAQQVGGCQQNGGLPCVQQAASRLASSFTGFADDVASLSYPATDQAAADRLAADARSMAASLDQMASASSASAYVGASRQFAAEAATFDGDYRTVQQGLNNG